MRPGQEERIEFEYIRHGTLCLIASFDVVTGESVSPTVGPTRTEEDFLDHCKRTVMLHPKSSWRLIMDQLNTHGSESLVRWVVAMEELKLSADELGVKGKSGILKSLATRKEFLSRAEAGRVHVTGCVASTPAGLYRLLQPHDGETVPVDIYRSAAHNMTHCS
jgi:hypothetical protein